MRPDLAERRGGGPSSTQEAVSIPASGDDDRIGEDVVGSATEERPSHRAIDGNRQIEDAVVGRPSRGET